MKRTSKYVALDVHQAMIVASVREEGGRIIARTVFPTEEQAILEFFRGMRGSIHLTFEEGTQAQWLYDLLVNRVDSVLVCERRGEKRHGSKGDRADADHLSELLRLGSLRAVYHGSPHLSTLKELTGTYQNMGKLPEVAGKSPGPQTDPVVSLSCGWEIQGPYEPLRLSPGCGGGPWGRARKGRRVPHHTPGGSSDSGQAPFPPPPRVKRPRA
jgi:hypothetical protein